MITGRLTVAKLYAYTRTLEKRILELEAVSRPVIHLQSNLPISKDPAIPIMGPLFMQFAHFSLPAGVLKGQIRIARILGTGTKGKGYANLRLDLNGDEGWDSDTLIIYNSPFSRGFEPGTWSLGV